MISGWDQCRRILCIRPDNMGDLLMSTPAIRALKNTFNCHITILTSVVAEGIAAYLPEIDEVISFDFPWVKNDALFDDQAFAGLIKRLQSENFDAAVIFSVYSQNPLPSAIVAFMAGIPLRLGYCRENPYTLLTDWVPDKEPYTFIRHQVRRDLDLVSTIGASITDEGLSLNVTETKWDQLNQKIINAGSDLSKPWLLFHPGVSEEKRLFPESDWITLAKNISEKSNYQILITGVKSENDLAERIAAQSGSKTFNLAGSLSLEEFILLVKKSPLVISVNTGTIHIAAATHTPVIVLYALTNPQHAPWHATGKVFPFSVPQEMQSKNEVIRHVSRAFEVGPVDLNEVVTVATDILIGGNSSRQLIPELIGVPAHP